MAVLGVSSLNCARRPFTGSAGAFFVSGASHRPIDQGQYLGQGAARCVVPCAEGREADAGAQSRRGVVAGGARGGAPGPSQGAQQVEGDGAVRQLIDLAAVGIAGAGALGPAAVAGQKVPHRLQDVEPPQIRAARALLGWKQTDLAKASGVSEMSVKNIERGATDPRASTLKALQEALEKAGVVFLDDGQNRDGGPGVRLGKAVSQ